MNVLLLFDAGSYIGIPVLKITRDCLRTRENPLLFYSITPSSFFQVRRLKIGEKNVGMIDRIIRIVLGIILIAVFALNMVGAPWSYLVVLIGIIVLATGVFGTCALYSLIGMGQ
jgi:hypothetical protein